MSRWLWEKGTSRLEYQKVKVLVAQSCPTLDPMDCSPPGSSDCGIFQAKRVGSHSLFQGIFLTQGLNPGLLHCRRILYHLGHQGNLAYCELATKVKLVKNTVSVTSQYLWSAIKQSTIKCGLPVVQGLPSYYPSFFQASVAWGCPQWGPRKAVCPRAAQILCVNSNGWLPRWPFAWGLWINGPSPPHRSWVLSLPVRFGRVCFYSDCVCNFQLCNRVRKSFD